MPTVEILFPVASDVDSGNWEIPISVRTVDNLRIGLLENGKAPSRAFLWKVGRTLAGYESTSDVVLESKPTAGKPATESQISSMASQVDVVVAGVGDCAGCAACSLHDAISFSRMGIPAAVIITEPFEPVVRSTAMALGMPNARYFTVPHPLTARDDTETDVLAMQLGPRLWKGLLGREVEQTETLVPS